MGGCLGKPAEPDAAESAGSTATKRDRQPTQPGASWSGQPEPCAEGSEELTVERLTAAERLGVHFRAGTLVLESVNAERAAARSGAAAYVGRRVTHCDGVPVADVAQFIAATQGRETTVLRFAPPDEAAEDGEAGGDHAPEVSAAGTLQVTVHGAGGLHAADRGGTSDPFVVVDVVAGGQEAGRKRRSKVLKRTLAPVWSERMEPFALPRGHGVDALVRATVWSDNLVSSPDILGFAELPIGARRLAETVAREEAATLWLGPRPGNPADEALFRRRGGQLGWLRISARATTAEDSSLTDSLRYASAAWAQGHSWDISDPVPFTLLDVNVVCGWDLRASPGGPLLDAGGLAVSVSASGALQGAWGHGAPRETRTARGPEPQWDERFAWELAPGAEEQGVTVQLRLADQRRGDAHEQPLATAELCLDREDLRRALVRPRGRQLPLAPYVPADLAPRSPRGKGKGQPPGEAIGFLMVVFRSSAQGTPDGPGATMRPASDREPLFSFNSGVPDLTPPCPLRDDVSVHSLRAGGAAPSVGRAHSPEATLPSVQRPPGLGVELMGPLSARGGDSDVGRLSDLKGLEGEEQDDMSVAGSIAPGDGGPPRLQQSPRPVGGGPTAPLRPLSEAELAARLSAFFAAVGAERDCAAIISAAAGREDDLYHRLRSRWPQRAAELEFLRAHWLLQCGGFVDDRSLPLDERLRRSLAREGALRDCDRLLRAQHGVGPRGALQSPPPGAAASGEPWPQLCALATEGDPPATLAASPSPPPARPPPPRSEPAPREPRQGSQRRLHEGLSLPAQLARARAQLAAPLALGAAPCCPPQPCGLRPRTPRRRAPPADPPPLPGPSAFSEQPPYHGYSAFVEATKQRVPAPAAPRPAGAPRRPRPAAPTAQAEPPEGGRGDYLSAAPQPRRSPGGVASPPPAHPDWDPIAAQVAGWQPCSPPQRRGPPAP
eukprot:TRINITY_DN2617_c0_g2_i1.p1 TRINITY_DN2617_c0_g2~~TRINITY_DN2617_c0_g2_i1.p1  ORF type:complete len:976 (+),score=201.90 TRINITY_DN2617_c0_g2_i1:84-2930(+)